MNRKRNKFDLPTEPEVETPEAMKARTLKKVAIAVAFLSTYYFFIKLLFL